MAHDGVEGLGWGQGKWEQCNEKQEPVTLWFPGRKHLEEAESLLFFSGRAGSSLLVVAALGVLTAVASLVVARGPQSTGSVGVVHGLRCSKACVIFLDQGWNPRPLHWQTNS